MHFGPLPNAWLPKRERTRKPRPLFPPNLHFLPRVYLPLSENGGNIARRPLTAIFPPGFGTESFAMAERARGFSLRYNSLSLSLSLISYFEMRFQSRGNMNKFIDIDLRSVKEFFLINLYLLELLREVIIYIYTCYLKYMLI